MTDATAHASGTPEGTSADGRTDARTLPTARARLAPPKPEYRGDRLKLASILAFEALCNGSATARPPFAPVRLHSQTKSVGANG
jgi:hypothetical protein